MITSIVSKETIQETLRRQGNQIFKLLPLREEGADWKKPLETTLTTLIGLNNLEVTDQVEYLELLSKLAALKTCYTENTQKDFASYRRVIFECCSMIGKIVDNVT